MANAFTETVITPIKAMRLRYVPLLMIYFAYGASVFSGIAESFFIKERLNLPAHALMMIAVWISIPWSIKMVFGQFVDSVPFLKSTRRSYVFFAAGLMAIGSLLMAGLAGEWTWILAMGSANAIFIVASLITVFGAVLQDVVADAISVEVVDRENRSEEEIRHELAMVQLLGRLSLSIAIFLVSGLGGWLAQIYSYQTIFLLTLIVPIISVTGALFIQIDIPQIKPINRKVFLGGLAYAAFVTSMAFSQFPGHQEIILVVSLIIVSILLFSILGDVDHDTLKKILFAALVIFIYRAMPPVGPGLQWWEIDVLGFNKAFFGTLAQIGSGLAIAGMWFFAKWLTEKPIGWILLILTLVSFILSLPVIGMYYGLHEWTQANFGFGAHTIALVDTALASPFAQMSMVPMLTLIAIHAPRGNAATWFALMASLMNLALTTGNLVSKWLNHIWVVTREVKDSAGNIVTQADYTSLGHLLWSTTLVGLILPLIATFLFLRQDVFSIRQQTSTTTPANNS
ncbi:MAG: hypothetical protein ACE365_01705 [Gammaproteobacteria bacterium]